LATPQFGYRSLAPAREEEHQREDGEDADRDEGERADDDREDRDQHHESLRDGGDPRDVSERSWAQAMSEPEKDEHDDDGDRERQQPRDRVDDEEQTLDDCDPDRDRDPTLAEPPAEAALAVLDHAWFKHAAKLPSGCREPDGAPIGEVLARNGALLAVGEEPVDRGPRSGDVSAEGAGVAKLSSERR